MPRTARNVFAGVPHHITQRGNRQEKVFFSEDDRLLYLEWLSAYSRRHCVDILAYCLMSNHVHLVMVPRSESGLNQVLKPLHMRYAQQVNRKFGWKGHLWQGRYFSSPLDERYTWAAIRYVELNPVRAYMVTKAEQYPWSSAAGHCGLCADNLLTLNDPWQNKITSIKDWSAWLEEGINPDELDNLRTNTNKCLPCGSNTFIKKMESLAGHSLSCRPRGRPRKNMGLN